MASCRPDVRPAILLLSQPQKARQHCFSYKMNGHDPKMMFFIPSIILSTANSHFCNTLLPSLSKWRSCPRHRAGLCARHTGLSELTGCLTCPGRACIPGQRPQVISGEGNIVNILGSVGHTVSIVTTKICLCSSNAATENR